MNSVIWNRVLALAHQSLWLSNPNPRVGCVLVDPQGQIIGQGFTQRAGEAHAEIMALQDAKAQGHSTRGATAYVSLEPCAHQGRTGPCCDALVAAGVRQVVASLADPNPLVAGQGFAKLRAAGVQVVVGPMAQESRALNIGFFSRFLRQTPWVRLKLAASLDGKTALPQGASQWITSESARSDTHAWRARACAVLTGIGTLLADQPRLDVRWVNSPRQPDLVLVDARLQVPLDAPIFLPQRRVLIYTARPDAAKQALLQARGVDLVCLPAEDPAQAGKVDLAAMLQDLGRRQINELHVEAGHRLNGALLRQGLVDELLVYLAPKLLGAGYGMADLPVLQALDLAIPLRFDAVDLVGPDLRILAQIQNRPAF